MSDRTCSIEGCAKPLYLRGWCCGHYARWRRKGDPEAQPKGTPFGAPLAFIELALTSRTDECIIWPFATDSTTGYGKVNVGGGKMSGAHRVVLERAWGPRPAPGMVAAHAPLICHNRACVNPRHLRWATQGQNHADKLIDGTHNRGERNLSAKLTAAQVLAIHRDLRPQSHIAAEYGIGQPTVSMIKHGRNWGWLTHTSKVGPT